MNPNYLDYFFFCIAANNGITKIDEFYLKTANTLEIPLIILITKIDKVSKEDLENFIESLRKQISILKIDKKMLVCRSVDDMVLFSRNLDTSILPTFLISSVKDVGLNEFVNFLNILPSRTVNNYNELQKEESQFDILEVSKKGDKIFLGGILIKGILISNRKYYLGPNSKGDFNQIEVTSMHCKRIDVKAVYKGQYCSLCISGDIKYDDIRKGMVLVSNFTKENATKCFEAELWGIDADEKKVSLSYKPVLHINNIRQVAKFKSFEEVKSGQNEEKKEKE